MPALKPLLLIAVLALPVRADELTLHVYPTDLGLDWSTPASLTRTVVLNALSDLITRNGTSIGHIDIDVDCAGSAQEPPRRVLSGMTQADRRESRRLLFGQGLGMGILFHDFKGELEDRSTVEQRLRKRAEKGNMSFVTFRIAPAACRRLVRYFDEYEAKGYGAHYGLPHRPLHREGAGCSAFGASFLKSAGLLSPELLQAWMKTISAPLQYVGGPLTGRHIALWKLLLSPGTQWAQGSEASKSVTFFEPDALHAWILSKVKSRQSGYEVAPLSRAWGIVIDATKVPVPAGPIWEKP